MLDEDDRSRKTRGGGDCQPDWQVKQVVTQIIGSPKRQRDNVLNNLPQLLDLAGDLSALFFLSILTILIELRRRGITWNMVKEAS